MSNKDFLEQFSRDNGKPESFQEEKRVPVQKPKRPFNPLMVIIPLVILLLIGALVWFFLLRPTIQMPDFQGMTKNDVAAWASQQQIEKNGVIFNEIYDLEYDDGLIIDQSIAPNTMVKKDVKLTFTISKGADPDEAITFPDINSMTQEELNNWKKEHKLNNTRIVTSYSDTVPVGEVVTYALRGCEESSFTRGCALNITVSKGQAPAGTVSINDFKNGPLSAVEAWGDTNKITLNITEVFDDKVAAGMVIDTNPQAGKTLKEGESLNVVVSKGKGIKVPSLTTMKKDEVDKWLKDNADYVVTAEKYANTSAYVISQSVKAGTMIGIEDQMSVTLNKGNGFYLADEGLSKDSIIGMTYNKLIDWCNEKRSLGIDSYAGQWDTNEAVYSTDYPKGQIVSVACSGYSDSKVYSCDDRLPLDVRFSVVVSKGQIVSLDLTEAKHTCSGHDNEVYETAKMVDILAAKGVVFANHADGEYCKVLKNGTEVKEDNLEVIKEEDGIVLESFDVSLCS